jgi:hypothetical protein
LTVSDPVIVVVTGASKVIPNDEYTSLASRGELLFANPDRVMEGLADAGVAYYVLGVSPFAQEAADKYREVKRDFSLQVFNLLAAITVLLITALSLSIVYCRRNAQALFVKYICGWSFLHAHRWILAVEGALMLIFTLWAWHSMRTIIKSYGLPGATPLTRGMLPLQGWEPVLASGIALFSMTLFVLALLRTNRTFVKTHSASLS